ncbi:hypothetical protein FJT64_021879 [Amphibalanus amphitrite]|uniref:Uncharacterized protein n=1 Tax=Amphibalanus amphitrite TaxID=1232801 RepID=A0A6A4WKP0_AMPAM|nr:hypothetical protein FJT64_021879 [Amphibalanus amphitrite]
MTSRRPVEPCSWSDHDLVIAETTLQRERRRPAEVTIRSTRDLVPDALCLELLVSDWSAVYGATDPADKWKAWLAVWSPVIDRHMPEKKIRQRHSPAPWITENDELQTMMRERDLADAERRAQPADEQAAQRYRLCRNRVKSAQFSAKSDFFLTSYRRSRRTTWKDIRRFLISPRAGASSASSSPSGPRWADRLNEYFASVGPSVAAALEEAQRVTEPLPPRPPRVVSGAFRVHPVTLSELSAAVKPGMSEPAADWEQFVRRLGRPGRYQTLVAALLSLNFVPIALSQTLTAFYGHTPPHHCRVSKATLLRWLRPGTDGLCSECGTEENTEHVICDCPRYQAARSRYLGHVPTLEVLQERPDAVVRFMRRTGLLQQRETR